MDFTLSDEQELLRDTARALFAKECPSQLVRDAFYDVTPDGPDAARELFDAHLRGWVGLGDGPLVDLCLFLEEAGRAVAPGPTWVTASMFVPLLRAAGHPDAERAAAGEVTGTIALAGANGRWVLGDDPVRTFVPHPDEVDLVAVVVPGPAVVVVERSALEVGLVETLDRSRPVGALQVPSDGERLPFSESDLVDVFDRGTVALAAELVGVGRWLMDTTLEYVRGREQFGKPVGSFQGLQWKLVDAALVLERAAAAVYYAAMCVDAGDEDARRAVHVAKAAAGAAATRWARDGLQAHGGIGFTWEHDLHLRLRRAYASDQLLGDSAWHHDRLAELLLDA